MKSAIWWESKLLDDGAEIDRADIKQIQLEAAKWGMEQASKVCDGHEDWMPADNDECKDAILAFAKNLTIDQLPR